MQLDNGQHTPSANRGFPDPIESDQPLVLVELIQRLKVRDVMTRKVISVSRDTPMRHVQGLMKTHQISGVPIAENGRLYGLVSIDNIVSAVESGALDMPAEQHMSTRLVVLEDDMPLSFAIRYFGRYRFGRFPVLNRGQTLVGIVSQRDITRALLLELARELQRMEARAEQAAMPPDEVAGLYMLREFPVGKFDLENAGKAATQIRQLLVEKGLEPGLVRRVAVVAYELEINICVHSDGGSLTVLITRGKVEIMARDKGPGIADVDWACRDGTSTANDWVRSLGFGAGLGLPNVKRSADEFEITSSLGSGTTVKAVIWLTGKNDAGRGPDDASYMANKGNGI
jgi:CBS domain-containing protein